MRGNGQEVIRTAGRWGVRGKVAVGIGLVACSTVVWQSSHAAFSDVTSNDANTLAAGTVKITDSDSGVAMFTPSNLAPGAAAVSCIGVEYTGTLSATEVKVYAAGAMESESLAAYATWTNAAGPDMDDYTNLQIEVNTADLNAAPANLTDCTPTGYGSYVNVSAAAPGTLLKTFINTNTNYSNGLSTNVTNGWTTVTANKWRVFRFTYTLNSNAPNSVQGDGVKFNVVWEAQH